MVGRGGIAQGKCLKITNSILLERRVRPDIASELTLLTV